jgi:hypothetical protein
MKPPSNESEIFMGSATVLVDGEPQSYLQGIGNRKGGDDARYSFPRGLPEFREE